MKACKSGDMSSCILYKDESIEFKKNPDEGYYIKRVAKPATLLFFALIS